MKKVLSGILALTLAGALTVPAFAATGDITATEVTTTAANEPEATAAPESLKESAGDEEGMLRISSSTLLKIKLQLEDEGAAGKTMSFLANQQLAEGEAISKEKIQFIDEKTIGDDGTVTIQFRPRANQPVGIYNMRANTKGATIFSRFYKTVKNEKMPVLLNSVPTPKGENIEIAMGDYTLGWRGAVKLYRVTDGAETEIKDYEIVTAESSAILKIPTASLAVGTHNLCFKPITAGGAYNPLSFTVTVSAAMTEYTVSFDETGVEAVKFKENAIPSGGVVLPTPEKTGYTFGGWYKDEDLTNAVTSPITSENLSDIFGNETSITLYAKWTPVEYSITYNLNEGINDDANPATYTAETETIVLADPTRTGYTFGGWYSDADFTAQVSEISKGSTGNKTLHAKWTANTYTITYETNGGAIDNESNYTSYTYGTALTLPTPTREGWHFIGWYDNGELSGNPVSVITATDIENKTFWAKWDENEPTEYMITFVNDDGTEIQKGMVNVGETPSCQTTPTKEQDDRYTYAFSGWTPEIAAVTQNATYTATYARTPRTYDVTYETDGGTIENESNYTSYTYGTAMTLPIPTKAGYDFDGWYSDSEFTTQITEISNNDTGNKNFYAKWNSVISYKILDAGKDSSKVKVIKRTDENAYIIVATYAANGNLVKATIKDVSSVKTTAAGEDIDVAGAFDGDYASAKVFMWNSLDKMQPRCPALPVNE